MVNTSLPCKPEPEYRHTEPCRPARSERGRVAKQTRAPQQFGRIRVMPGDLESLWPRVSSTRRRAIDVDQKNRRNPRAARTQENSEVMRQQANLLAEVPLASPEPGGTPPQGRERTTRRNPRAAKILEKFPRRCDRRTQWAGEDRSFGREEETEPCQGEVSKRRATIALVRILLKCRQRAGGSTVIGVGR